MTDDAALRLVEHDMRSAIAVVLGYAELLRMRDDEELRLEASDRLIEAAGRLRDLLDGLLATLEGTAIPPPD